jgi:ParB family chromosome partitioning protein
MSKQDDLLARLGSNLAESMGAGRAAAPTFASPAPDPGRDEGTRRLRAAAEIGVDRIAPDPNQPRTEFDPESLARLAASLETHGQLQPISVRWNEGMGRYLIVTGERRWRAAQLAGRRTIAAVVLADGLSDSKVLEMQLIENALREDLQPIEQARAFLALMDRNGWPASRVAEVLHINPGTITRALALLDLPAAVQEQVAAGTLAPTVAYEVSKVPDRDGQAELARRAVAEGLNRAEVVAEVRRVAGGKAKRKGRGARPRPRQTSRMVRTALGRVTLDLRRPGDPDAFLALLEAATASVRAELEETAAAGEAA